MEALPLSFSVMLGFSIQFSTLWRSEQWRKLYKNLKFDCQGIKIRSNGAFFEVLIVHVFFFARLVLIVYAWLSMVNIRAVLTHFSRLLVDYFAMILVLMLIHVNTVIKRKFLLMNDFLKRANCIRHIQEMYTQNTDLIDDFNSAFGYQILFMIFRAISVILECLHNSLKYPDLKGSAAINMFFWSWFYSITVIVIDFRIYSIIFF